MGVCCPQRDHGLAKGRGPAHPRQEVAVIEVHEKVSGVVIDLPETDEEGFSASSHERTAKAIDALTEVDFAAACVASGQDHELSAPEVGPCQFQSSDEGGFGSGRRRGGRGERACQDEAGVELRLWLGRRGIAQ
jgi:hypothetical protein